MNKLMQILSKETRLVVGLMSGTSLDGIDAALVQISGSGLASVVELLEFVKVPYSPELRAKILELCQPETGTVEKISRRNFLLGELFAEAALQVIKKAGLTPEDIDLIGSHGQTIYHQPQAQEEGGYSLTSTLQIGEPAVISERTGILTVADFRVRDMAAGGQGAPLVPYTEYILYREPAETVGLQNIGGIANVTVLPAGQGLDQVWAFDNGPGNMIMDQVVQRITHGGKIYDEGGEMAHTGMVNRTLLEKLMQDPYLHLLPPKTTGREYFGAPYVEGLMREAEKLAVHGEDLVATVTAFTARAIAESYREFVIPRNGLDKVLLGGGGSYNQTLVTMLRGYLPEIKVVTHEEIGFNSDAKEAVAFALLANETINGSFNNVPSATGALHSAVMGKISM